MPQTQYLSNFNIGGLNLYINPLYHGYVEQAMQQDGELIRAVNVDSHPLGGKMRRSGYFSLLNATGSQVNNLFNWNKDDGTTCFLYNYSGGTLFYYDVAVGTQNSWLPCGNGTFGGTHVGYTILNNTLITGDGVNPTRHSTDGTSFTNTTLAPVGEYFEQYQNRIYIGGTASTLFYSTSGDPTNWNIAGTSDSSSFTIPGQGKINKLYKLGDRLHISKSVGNVFRWDGYSLVDTASNLGMSSPYSYGTIEDSGIYLNRLGVYTVDINGPQIISNPISRYIYNENDSGVAGSCFGTAPGVVYRYDYYCNVGSIQDDFTYEPLNNAVIKYNFLKNEWLAYQYANTPSSFCQFRNTSGSQNLIWGDSTGQVYQRNGTAYSDNGAPINSVIDMVFNFNAPHFDKDWRWFWGFFNPGCEAQVQVALTDTFTRQSKKWVDLGDARTGVVKYRFPTGSRSKILYVRIKDSSRTSRFIYYGCTLGAIVVDPG